MAALEYASGCTAQVVGKPEPSFFNSVLKEIDCPVSEAVMIGDVSAAEYLVMVGYSVSILYNNICRTSLTTFKVLKTWE